MPEGLAAALPSQEEEVPMRNVMLSGAALFALSLGTIWSGGVEAG